MARENFFVLLELPFDPPPSDPAQIRAAIQKKHQEWSRMHDNPQSRSLALNNMSLVPDMEQVLLDKDMREKEAAKAIEIRDKVLPSFRAELNLVEGKGYIHPRDIKELRRKYGRYGINEIIIREHAVAPITDIPPKEAHKAQIIAMDYATASSIYDHLNVLGIRDLYQFLQLDNNAALGELSVAAQKKQHEAFHAAVKDAQTVATQQLGEHATEVFESQDTRAAYDEYLKVSQHKELNDLIMQEYDQSGYISPEILLRLVNFGVTTYDGSILEIEEYIRDFCRAYDIKVDMAAPEITCPNCEKQMPRGATYCSNCAAPLEGACPQCGTFFSDGVNACISCGFDVGSMGKALDYIVQTENALIENDWSSAQNSIEYIQQYWPGHPKIDTLKHRSKAVENHYDDILAQIESAYKENRFYAARSIASAAEEKNYPLPKDILININNIIGEFEQELSQLKKFNRIEFETLSKLSLKVSDSLELERLLAQFPPNPPSRFTARPQGEMVTLNWSKSPSPGNIIYIVVRKQGSVPLTAFDGDVVYQGEENYFVDNTIPPLETFFYSLFVKRGSTFSEIGAVAPSPVRVAAELKNFKIIPGDRAVQLTWDPPEDLAEVLIWRTEGADRPIGSGEGEELKTDRLDGYTDSGLENDKTYWYYVVAVYYTEQGERIRSLGVSDSVVPRKLVSPVDLFDIVASDANNSTYIVNWQSAPDAEVVFFTSSTKPGFALGQMIPVEELVRGFGRITLENKTQNSAQFHLRFNGGIYVFPVVISGRFGAMGSSRYLTYVPDVENPTYDIINKDLYINFRWPTSAIKSVKVAWRQDNFTGSPDQKGTETISCTRQQYDLDAGVRLNDLGKGEFFFTIYSEFVSQQGEEVLSTGVDLIVDNTPAKEFYYTIKYSKKMFSSVRNFDVTIEGKDKFHLPKALLVGKVGSLPTNISDGEGLFEIERAKDVNGSITYEYKTKKIPNDMYIRLFFYDEDEYLRLRPIPTGSLKLT